VFAAAPRGWGHPTIEVENDAEALRLTTEAIAAARAADSELEFAASRPSPIAEAMEQMIESMRARKGEAAAQAMRSKFPAAARLPQWVELRKNGERMLVVEHFAASDFRRGLNQMATGSAVGVIRFGEQRGLLWSIAGAGLILVGQPSEGGALLLYRQLGVTGESDAEQEASAAACRAWVVEQAARGAPAASFAFDEPRVVAAWCPASGLDLDLDLDLANGDGSFDGACVVDLVPGTYRLVVGEHELNGARMRWCLLDKEAP
jgi:hypothetical protein